MISGRMSAGTAAKSAKNLIQRSAPNCLGRPAAREFVWPGRQRYERFFSSAGSPIGPLPPRVPFDI